jgi:hypothetical protein
VGAGFEEFAGESAVVSASGFEVFMLSLLFGQAVIRLGCHSPMTSDLWP